VTCILDELMTAINQILYCCGDGYFKNRGYSCLILVSLGGVFVFVFATVFCVSVKVKLFCLL